MSAVPRRSKQPDKLPDLEDSARCRDGPLWDYQEKKALNVSQAHLAQVNSSDIFCRPGSYFRRLPGEPAAKLSRAQARVGSKAGNA